MNSNTPLSVPLSEDFSRFAESTTDSPTSSLDHQFDSNSPFGMTKFDETNFGYTFNSSLQNGITTNPPGSRSKRQKKTTRTRPCTCCRRRKTKCVVPPNSKICLECAKRNIDCTFDTPGDELSSIKSLRICDNCNHRRTTCVVPKGCSMCTECTLRDLPCKFSEMVNSNAKIRTNIPITDYDEYQGHTMLKKTLSLQGPKSAKLIGESSLIDKRLINFNTETMPSPPEGHSPTFVLKKEQIQYSMASKLRKINDETIFRIVNDNEEYIKLSYAQVDEVEKIVYPHGLALLNLFFDRVHPLLPVCSRSVFLEKYSRTQREFEPMNLAMVYLHAINYWNLNPDLSNLELPNYEKLERLVLILYSDQQNLMHSAPKLSTCQALILMMHYNFKGLNSNSTPLFEKDDNWKKVNQIVTIAEELGLNHSSDEWYTIPKWERRIRKICSWALIMLDKTFALLESRPTRISADNWVLNELEFDDFLVEQDEEVFIEKTDGENFVINRGTTSMTHYKAELSLFGNLIFTKMVHLSYHYNDALTAIYNWKSIKFDDLTTVYEKCQGLLKSLTLWYNSMPSQVKEVQIVGSQISSVSLVLSYYLLQFLIHRRIIDSFLDSEHILTDDQLHMFKVQFKQTCSLLVEFNENFMKRLTNEHFTNCFWYATTTMGFTHPAIVYQLMIKLTKEEHYIDDQVSSEQLESVYRTYIECLRAFEPVSPNVSRALDHIQTYLMD
ncbi:unnamed protein product [Cyberlindnera jadinii]|uniref:Zn(2)-C6 fungal-type domain-containing protein n=1 Tax=Cyberlindnera jadinii (strain ATCC 18201 / CBS 1600 / BCRC 20928 / JCM 3617 / NBRC 0987 / NRRL Y-1542) TaxID=983966 RepID=A0A0H5C963_CYBJN|nr:unnamed protein product [Cyberlindnera jadinii]